MLNVGVLIVEELNQVLDKEHQTKLPGIVGWNLIRLSYNMFIKEYGTVGFDSFKCPEGVGPLLFSQLCIYHHSDVQRQMTCLKKDQQNFSRKGGLIGQVTIGSNKNAVCVCRNSAITVPG